MGTVYAVSIFFIDKDIYKMYNIIEVKLNKGGNIMFSDVWNKIKEMIRKMLPKKSIEDVIHISPAISDKMADAIQLWSDMYEGHSPWIKEATVIDPTRIVSLGLPAFIASEKARMATLEMKTEVTAPTEKTTTTNDEVRAENDESTENLEFGVYDVTTKDTPIGPTERADFLQSQYERLLKQIRRQLEYGIAKGGLVIKPYIVIHDKTYQNNRFDTTDSNDTTKTENGEIEQFSAQNEQNSNIDAEIEFDYIQADRFFPLSFDANGKVVEAAFIQTKTDKAKERVYIRLEYHKLEGRRVTVQNFAFESTDMELAQSNNLKSSTNLGNPILLGSVPEWANLQPVTQIDNVDRLLFAYFKMPEANTVDPYSPLGVSGYSRVIQLIKDADMQYSRLLWEFEGGELAIDVDRDALAFIEEAGGYTHSVNPINRARLFRKVDLNTEDTYNVFAPALRDVSLTNGLNTIFQRIEDSCGLSRGTISEYAGVEVKTATELKIQKQRSYATNADIQQALQQALEDVVYVMNVYCTLYEITPEGEYDVSFEWDDSIIVDNESELSKRLTLMQNGLASKIETRMWYFGETENQAKLALQKVQEESLQALKQNVEAEQMFGTNNTGKEPETSISDNTSQNKSTGQQADNLNNPDKSKTADNVKNK